MNESHGTPFRRTNCRGCNKPVVFGTNKAIDPDTGGPRNTVIPFDPMLHVYAVRMANQQTIALSARDYVKDRSARAREINDLIDRVTAIVADWDGDHQAIRTFVEQMGKLKMPIDDDVAFYVSHFQTCPAASRFSKKGDDHE